MAGLRIGHYLLRTKMKRLLLALLFATSLHAQTVKPNVFTRVRSYVSHHKELLAADGLIGSAWSLDAWSSVRCQNISPACTEQNPFLGPHPSAGATWGFAMGFASAQIALNHLAWHYAPSPGLRHLIWFFDAPFLVYESFNIRSNIDTGNNLKTTMRPVRTH
jgi:hypothetical protein